MIWIDIPGWGLRYQINEFGQIRSKDMRVNAKNNSISIRKGRRLIPIKKSNGYLCVTLTDGVNRAQIAIHRLVARAFIGECPMGLHVLHNDGDKNNNHWSNLRYGTPAENHADTKRHGNRILGEKHHSAKLTDQAVRQIRDSGWNTTELSKLYGVSRAHISAIRNRRVWTHI